MKKVLVASVISAISLLAGVLRVEADNDYQSQPPPESADQLITSFDQGLEGEPARPTPLREILQNSHLKLKLRNYYLNRKRPENTDPLAWAQGGSLEYKADKVGGHFGFHAEYFGSFRLYAPDEHDGTLLLEPGQNNIDVFGVANPRATYEGNLLTLYRQRIDLPFVNGQDNRMIPNTFEAYLLAMPKTENEKFQYVLGYISRMKPRNEDTFNSMSDVAGVNDVTRGMLTGGARYYFVPEFSLGAVNYFVEDIFNIFYTEAIHKRKISEKMASTFSAQWADQRSNGDDLLRDRDFSTGFLGVQEALSYNYLTLKLAYTWDDTGGDIRSPYGSYPGYNSSIVEDFNRAGEEAWQIGLAYNFNRIGLKGLGLTAAYIQGNGAIDESTKEGIPDRNETDVTLDYKVGEGMLKGFWLRLRGAFINEDGGGSTEDYRVIVNYDIALYEPAGGVAG